MRRSSWTPSTVLNGTKGTVYIVVDDFGGLGRAYRETDVAEADLETIITNLMSGRFNDPTGVVAFNTAEHWAQDVSEEVAREIQARCEIVGVSIPDHIHEFIVSFTGPTGQRALRSV